MQLRTISVTADGTLDIESVTRVAPGDSIQLSLAGFEEIVSSPDGVFLYAVNSAEDSLAVFRRSDQPGEEMSSVATYRGGFQPEMSWLRRPVSVAIAPDGHSVYVAVAGGNAIVRCRRLADGRLESANPTEISPANGELRDLVISPDGRALYAITDSRLLTFTISGSLVQLTDIRALVHSSSLAISEDGAFVYATNSMPVPLGPEVQSLSIFEHDTETSLLSLSATQALPGANLVAAGPHNDYVYVTVASGEILLVFRRNADSHVAFQGLAEADLAGMGLSGVSDIACSQDGQYVFVLDGEGGAIGVFRHNEVSGLLEFVQLLESPTTMGLTNALSLVAGAGGAAFGNLFVASSRGQDTANGGVAWFTYDAQSEPRRYSVGFEAPLARFSLLTGAGPDVVSLIHPALVELLRVDTAGGDDRVVAIQLGVKSEVNTGVGEDCVEIRSPESAGVLTVNTGEHDDRIDVMQIGPSSLPTIDAGPGRDTIRVLGYRLESDVALVQGGDPDGLPGDALIFDAGVGTCEAEPNGHVGVTGSNYDVAYQGIETLQCLEDTAVVSATAVSTAEGSKLTLHATATVTLPPENFTWDLNGDGDFTDATGPSPMLTWQQLVALGIDDNGVYDIAVRLTVAERWIVVSMATTTVTIANKPPAPAVELVANSVNANDPVELLLGANDPGDDHIARWEVDWGNGGLPESYPGDASMATHVYPSPGTVYSIHVKAEDEDGRYYEDKDFAVLSVDVGAPPPSAGNPLVPYRVYEGNALTMHGTAVGSPAQWAWDI